MSIGEAKMSEKLCFELIKQFWYFKNSNNGIGKLVVFLNEMKLKGSSCDTKLTLKRVRKVIEEHKRT